MGGVCEPAPNCMDGMVNGGETDVDCGGATACPRCANGFNCLAGSDCLSSVCSMSRCQTPSCTDMIRNGGESDVDCGGMTMCARCATGKMCTVNGDCLSSICSGGTCQ